MYGVSVECLVTEQLTHVVRKGITSAKFVMLTLNSPPRPGLVMVLGIVFPLHNTMEIVSKTLFDIMKGTTREMFATKRRWAPPRTRINLPTSRLWVRESLRLHPRRRK